mmetsp:Transcript_36319/g.81831  ORF Transcript_36319/g.81831 Transcript_36319/m.81831 type:complete len:348 (-) Transcript_36319:18-1061(-)
MNNNLNVSMANRPPILPMPPAMLQINATQPNDLRKKLEARKVGSHAAVDMGARLKTSAIPPKPTCAYAKLEGPKLRHFVVTSSVMLGRNRMLQKGTKRKLGEMQTSCQDDSETMSDSFVGLGWNTNISKRHIEILYDFRRRNWVLLCYGKNGVWIDSTFVAQNSPPWRLLKSKTRIYVPGAHFFYFLCPSNPASSDASLDKPVESLKYIIGQVLAACKDRRAGVVEIVEGIKKKFPFYGKQPDAMLQNSVKQCLATSKCFAMTGSDPSGGNHPSVTWTVDAGALAEMLAEKALDHPDKPPASVPPPVPTNMTQKTEVATTESWEAEEEDNDDDSEDGGEGGMVIDDE